MRSHINPLFSPTAIHMKPEVHWKQKTQNFRWENNQYFHLTSLPDVYIHLFTFIIFHDHYHDHDQVLLSLDRNQGDN